MLFLLCYLIPAFTFAQAKVIDEAWENYNTNTSGNKHILEVQLLKAQKENAKQNEAKCLSYLGVIADIEGDSKNAIQLLLSAIRIQECNHFEKDLSFSYNNLGIAHFYQNNYNLALNYYKKSYAIDTKLKDKRGAVGTLVNMGLIYTYQKKTDDAVKNYRSALKIYEELGDSSGMGSVYNNLAKIEFERKQYISCLDLYEKTEKVITKSTGIEVVFTTYFGMANTYLQLKQYAKSIENAEIAIEKAKAVNARERLQYGYELLAQAHSASGNHQLAYTYLEKFANLRDSIVNKSNSAAIADMNAKYESEKKDNIILQGQKNDLKQQQKLDNFKINLIVSISIILLLIVGLIFVGYRNKSAKKLTHLLQERNEAIQINLKQKELMIGEIHHRVKNNLQLISSIIDLHARTLDEGKERAVLFDSKKRVESIALVHQKLYQNDEIYSVQLDEYFTDLGRSILKNFQSENLLIELHVSTMVNESVHLDSAIPLGLIVSELITNSLKYAFENVSNPRIDIRIDRQHNALILHYFDNGNGFLEETWNESKSFGKKMIGSLLRQLKAEVTFSGTKGFHAAFQCLNITWK